MDDGISRLMVTKPIQQVEDNLAALRIIQTETEHHQFGRQHARKAGHLQSIDIDGSPGNRLTRRQLDASVLLIKALGGGWDTAQPPKM
jgi:hypothetical protein